MNVDIPPGRHRLRHRRRQLHQVPEPDVLRRRRLLVQFKVELRQPGRPLGGRQQEDHLRLLHARQPQPNAGGVRRARTRNVNFFKFSKLIDIFYPVVLERYIYI